ncbi:MAG TPA: hypothetical protein VGH89_25255 [Pseudonocardia sp.]
MAGQFQELTHIGDDLSIFAGRQNVSDMVTRRTQRRTEMDTMAPTENTLPDPLSSGTLRFYTRPTPKTTAPSDAAIRPLSLRHAVPVPKPERSDTRYCDELQVAVTPQDGVPMLKRNDEDNPVSKEWKTKFTSDGDEGEEEEYGWEEQ